MPSSPPSQPFAFGVVLLAAGRSRRMGGPKLVLPWGRTTVLGHLLAQWRALGARQLTVVCATGDPAIEAELNRLEFPSSGRIYNPAPERGMFSSIQAASQWPHWSPALTHWALALGDQPHLQPETLLRGLEFCAAHPRQVCQPARRGHGRHPVFFPREVFLRLGSSPAAHLKEFLSTQAGSLALWESEDAGLDRDMDTPEDYQALLHPPRSGAS